jgi:cytochrome c
MDSFEVNKIASAIIGAGLVTMVISIAGGALVSPAHPAQPAYAIAAAEPVAPQGSQPAQQQAPQVDPVAPLLAAADTAAGERVSRQCATCHTFTQGGRVIQGPNLYGVVGGPKAHLEGFNYSPAMRAAAAQPGEAGQWTYEELNKFLANPQADIRGTRMNFAGLRRAQDRANLIAWLRTQSANPPPLP